MSGEPILVVAEEPSTVCLCVETLALGGYQVQGAGSEREALTHLGSEQFDLLLLDLTRHGSNAAGLSLLTRARALDPDISAVAMVAADMLPTAIKAVRAGARGFVLKPYEPDDLLLAVREALEERWQNRILPHARCPIPEIFHASMMGADLQSRVARLLEVVVRQFKADRALLLLLDEETTELYVAGSVGVPAEAVEGMRISCREAAVRQALEREEPWVVDNPNHLDSPLRALMADPDMDSTWFVPLRTTEKTVGVLTFGHLAGSPPLPPAKGKLLSVTSGQIAVAVQNARLIERLRDLKTFNENIVQSLEEGILLEDATGHITFVNPRTSQLLGYAPQELLGHHWTAIVAPEYVARVEEESAKRSQGTASRYEAALLTREGLHVPVIVSARPLFDDGRFDGTLVVLTDITEHKQMEERLRESRQLLSKTFASLPDAIFLLDAEARIIDCNPAAPDIFGYRREEMLGQTTDMLHVDRAALEEFRKHLYPAVEENGFLSQLEFKMKRKDGKVFYTEPSVSPLVDEQGRRFGWVSVVRDISKRKKAQEDLERRNEELMALNAISTTMSQSLDMEQMLDATLDKLLEVVDIDGGWIQLLDEGVGREALKMVTNRGFSRELAEETDRIMLGESMTGRVAQSGQPIVVGNVSDDPRLTMQTVRQEALHAFIGVPIKSKDRVLGVLGVFSRHPRELSSQEVQTVTAVGHQIGVAIENLQLAKQASEIELLRKLDRLRSELIANVSHELRTPLGLIKLACTTLMREDVDVDRETRREFLRDISDEADRLERIVGNLLDLSQMSDGRLRLEKLPTDVGQLAGQVMESMKGQLTDGRLVHDFPADPLIVRADPERIEQVLRNLLSNAIKYSPQGGTIAITGRESESQVSVSVSDQGIGIPQDDVERVFERFYRVENESTQRVRGAGLGLAVCQNIIEAHGGRIWIESTLGVGATVCFTLPIGTREDSRPAVSSSR